MGLPQYNISIYEGSKEIIFLLNVTNTSKYVSEYILFTVSSLILASIGKLGPKFAAYSFFV